MSNERKPSKDEVKSAREAAEDAVNQRLAYGHPNGKKREPPLPLPPTPQRMYDLLKDQRPHTREEVHRCLSDTLGPVTNISPHIAMLRKLLRMRGDDILCFSRPGDDRTWYRLLIGVHGPEDAA